MTTETERKAVVVRIRGRVQGVWYRGWVVAEAKRRTLRGWVRNRSDGSVEALIAGDVAAVDAMVADCWHGPPAARVVDIATEMAAFPEDDRFHPLATL